jgi:hypothetical protein
MSRSRRRVPTAPRSCCRASGAPTGVTPAGSRSRRQRHDEIVWYPLRHHVHRAAEPARRRQADARAVDAVIRTVAEAELRGETGRTDVLEPSWEQPTVLSSAKAATATAARRGAARNTRPSPILLSSMRVVPRMGKNGASYVKLTAVGAETCVPRATTTRRAPPLKRRRATAPQQRLRTCPCRATHQLRTVRPTQDPRGTTLLNAPRARRGSSRHHRHYTRGNAENQWPLVT